MSKRFQVIEGGVVVNVLSFDDTAQLSGNSINVTGQPTFPAPDGTTLNAQDGAGIGWLWNGTALVAPTRTEPTRTRDELTLFANSYQWNLASGGHNVTVAGASRLFTTDDVSLSLMTGKAVRLMQAGAPTNVVWQMPGEFITINAADFLTLASAIADWVQSTFDALPAVLAAIQAGTITTFSQVKSASWPTP